MKKICKSCNVNKEIKEFHKDKNNSTGFHSKCKECRKDITKKDYIKNSFRRKKVANDYYYKNKSKVLKSNLEYQKKKLLTDIKYKLTRNLRNRLYYALKNKNWKKDTHFTSYIGCTKEDLVMYLESRFQNGMSWDNYGDWHIDHRVPLSSARSTDEMYKMCHYTNLYPMWAEDNIRKSNHVK